MRICGDCRIGGCRPVPRSFLPVERTNEHCKFINPSPCSPSLLHSQGLFAAISSSSSNYCHSFGFVRFFESRTLSDLLPVASASSGAICKGGFANPLHYLQVSPALWPDELPYDQDSLFSSPLYDFNITSRFPSHTFVLPSSLPLLCDHTIFLYRVGPP